MNILATQFDLAGRSLDIYLAGCAGPHCPNCHNPESHDFHQGTAFDHHLFRNQIQDKVNDFPALVKNLRVLGGEPLDQPEDEICLLLESLRRAHRDVWIFTGRDFADVPDYIRDRCEYVKCGRYQEALLTDSNVQYGITLASSNQRIYKYGVDYI